MSNRKGTQLDLRIILMEMRASKGMTAKEMAQELSISPAYLSSVAHGKTVPSAKFLKACIQQFNLTHEKAFALYTAAYMQTTTVTLDFAEVCETGVLDKETLAKLIAVITLSTNIPKRILHTLTEKPEPIIDNEIINLREAIDSVWKMRFADPSA